MTDRIAANSVQLHARLAGVLYLMVIVAGGAGFYISSALTVRGNATATAHYIMASELLFRTGAVADLIAGMCYVGVTAILYELLKPVNRTLSLAAAFFSLMGIATGAAITAMHLAPVMFLGSAQSSLAAFSASQLETLSFMSLRLYGQGENAGIVFFGVYCVLIGWLILRSAFLPRLVGVLMIVAGLTYQLNSFSIFLAPSFAARVVNFTLPFGFIGEAALTVWLLAFGVNVARWKEWDAAKPGYAGYEL
jgi:hypothetical protein